MDRSPADSLDIDIRSGTRRSAMIVGGLVAAGVAGLAVVIALNMPAGDDATPDAGPPIDAAFNHGRHATAIKILRLELEREPCVRRKAKQLAKKLNNAGDYRGTIEFVNRYHATCERYPRILWNLTYAHEQLEEYEAAIPVITSLIKDRPQDEDFWWWRAQDHAKSNRIDFADADYRQSMAVEPNKFVARRYPRLMKDITPCEVAWSLQLLIDKRPDQVAQWMREDLAERYLAGDCDKVRGKGKVSIPLDSGSPLIETKATLNGHEGEFAVQQNTAFVVLSRTFAESAKISLTSVDIPIYVAGTFLTGKRAIVESLAIGEAVAPRVVAVVVDELPGERDGVIGLSFLWRFQTLKTQSELQISAR